MKKYLIIPVVLLFSSGLTAQGLYNNGGKMVIGSGAYVYIDGTGGNLRNETNVSNGAIALDGTLTLEGNYTNNVAASDILATVGASSQVRLLGASAQTLGGSSSAPFVFNDLVVNNPGGAAVSRNATVNGVLTLTDGLVDIGNNDFTFGPSATVAGTPSASSMLLATGSGQVKKRIGAIGSFTFPVGDNVVTAGYSPVTLNFTSGTYAPGAFAGINLVNAAYPDPYITGSYLNRYWNVTQTGISSFSCNAVFKYETADIVGTESDIYCVRITPPPVTPFDPADISLHQLTAGGLTSFGTFTGALGIKFLNLTLFLEGLYTGSGTMSNAQGVSGNEYPGTTADQITIELHDPVTYSNMLYSIGNVDLSTTGSATVHVPSNFTGSYYVTVKNRNHIATVTSLPVDLTNPIVDYNFTTNINKAFGDNLKTLEPGVFGLYAGDPNGDGAVDALDLLAIQNDATLFSTGYLNTDLNGDGHIDVLDLILAQNNAILFISSITP